MIDYPYAKLFLIGGVHKQLTLTFDEDEKITNENIYSESMTIEESICSDQQLTFGTCEASSFKIRIVNSFVSHIGQELDVKIRFKLWYLWNYEVVTFSGSTTSTSSTALIGTYDTESAIINDDTTVPPIGEDIISITNYWGISTSSQCPSSYSTSYPSLTSSGTNYLWNYKVMTDSNGNTWETDARLICTKTGTGTIDNISSYYRATVYSNEDSIGGDGYTTDVSVIEVEPFQVGTYVVQSDTPSADRLYRDIVAYDDIYTIINADVADWYNELLPDEDSTCTLKEFRDSFFDHFGIEQEKIELVNDDMTIEKTISPSELSGLTVINAICEINGCFGKMTRERKFKYIVLESIMNSTDSPHEIESSYRISCEYEDFETPYIDCLQLRQEEDDAGYMYGDGDNVYVIQDNFLIYGKDTSDLRTIAANIYGTVKGIAYRPASVSAAGTPCLETGDGILLDTTYQEVRTYILKRTLTGVQALWDTYEANGAETYSEDLNSLSSSIIQLKGKTNTLTRTVEETISEIADVEEGLTNTIKQTVSTTLNEIAKTSNAWDNSDYEDALTSYGEPDSAGYDAADYNGQYYIDQNTGYVYLSDGESWTKVAELTSTTAKITNMIESSISDSESTIRQEISATYATIVYADEAASDAESTANAYTDGKLVYYSTTTEMTNAITQTVSDMENSITSEISTTYATKVYADEAASDAESAAEGYTDNLLASYYTMSQVNSITQTITEEINQIKLDVADTYFTQSDAVTLQSTLESSITANTTSITAEVTRATSAESTLSAADTKYGTCSTEAGTAAKVVSCSSFTTLSAGALICVYFTYANTAASPTLNVNSTGAKTIYAYGAAITSGSDYNWTAKSYVNFMYDGTHWVLIDAGASSKITMLADSISLSVSSTTNGTASIVLSVDGEDTGTVSAVSSARTAFAAETSSITISAGTITFSSGTLIIDSSQFTLTSAGNATFKGTLSAASGTFNGTVTTTSGSSSAKMTTGGLYFYYDDTLRGSFVASTWNETTLPGIAMHLTEDDYFMSFSRDDDGDNVYTAAYYISYSSTISSYRHNFNDTAKFSGAVTMSSTLKLESTLYMNNGKTICWMDSDGVSAPMMYLNSSDYLQIGDTTYCDSIYLRTAGRVRLLCDGSSTYYEIPQIYKGSMTITPSAANTPTSKTLTLSGGMAGTPEVFLTLGGNNPGTVMLGTSVSGRSSTGFTCWVTRTNTSDTTVMYLMMY